MHVAEAVVLKPILLCGPKVGRWGCTTRPHSSAQPAIVISIVDVTIFPSFADFAALSACSAFDVLAASLELRPSELQSRAETAGYLLH